MDAPKRWTDILAPSQFDLGHFTGDTQVSLEKQEHGKNSNLKVLIFFLLSRIISYLQLKARGWGWGAYASHFPFKKVRVKACDWIFCLELPMTKTKKRSLSECCEKRVRERERKICVRFLRYIWKNKIIKKNAFKSSGTFQFIKKDTFFLMKGYWPSWMWQFNYSPFICRAAVDKGFRKCD